MTKSLFNPSDNKDIVNRLNKLTGESKPLWGKMDVTQMLAHAQMPLKVASGELKLKQGLFGMLFGKMAKKGLLKPGNFKPNLPTAPEFIVKEKKNFDEEKQKLIHLVEKFAALGESGLTKDAHPFFGKMTAHEWDTIQWKHLDHHQRQFGL
jgi:hypothetical protein